MNDGRKWAAIVARYPKKRIDEFFGQWLLIDNFCDRFGIKIGSCCIFYNNPDCTLAAERNFDDLADFEWRFGGISQKII